MPLAAADPCDIAIVEKLPGCQVVNGVQGAAAAVDVATDPIGYAAQKLQQAAAGLADQVLPAIEKLTHPDLSAAWFIDAYQVSFGLAVLVFCAFVGWNFVQLSRRRVSGDEVAETLTFYVPAFFVGTLFGPLAGTGLLRLTGALSDALISWGITGTMTSVGQALQTVIAAGSPDAIAGGAVVAALFYLCMVIALLLTFVVLLVMLVTLYMTGVIIPLSLVWLVNPRQRSKGLKVVMVWVGICFSHVLLFLMLGVAFRMIAGLGVTVADPKLQTLANLAVAVIALLLATLSPLGLLKFAPVGPSAAAGGGPSLSLPSRSGGGYLPAAGDSQTAQLSRDSAETAGGSAGGGDGTGTSGGTGGLMGMMNQSPKPATTSASMEGGEGGDSSDSGGSNGTADTGGASTPSTGGATSAAPTAASSNAATDTDEQPAGGGSPLAGVSGSADRAGDSLTSAGSAVTATGAGAPLGAALAVAGQGLKLAASATNAVGQMAQTAGDMAGEHMAHGDTHQQGGK